MFVIILLFCAGVYSDCDVINSCYFDYLRITFDSNEYGETPFYKIEYSVKIDNITTTLNDKISQYFVYNYFNKMYEKNVFNVVYQCIVCSKLPTKISLNLNMSPPIYKLLVYTLIPIGLIVGIAITGGIFVCLNKKNEYSEIK